jgi:diguanylate cyclase (GGDEF)-like protein
VGDAVLAACAQRLQAQLRHNDGIARWGGEEFLVWLPATGLVDARRVAEKLRLALADSPLALPGSASLPVTLSAGIALLADGETVEQALARADRALYRAKAEGRNRVAVD